jgi:protein gp37
MSAASSIEWCDATWNPVRGCTKVSPGCKHCYAETFSERFRGVPGHPFEQGFDLRLVPSALELPLRWRKPRRVFVNSMSDLFHESIPNEYIAAVFGVMAAAPQHTFQILTKRAERMRAWFEWVDKRERDGRALFPYDDSLWRIRQMLAVEAMRRGADVPPHHGGAWPLDNVWLGVSVEDQQRADERIPLLLETPAAVRFVSAEPLLERVDIGAWLQPPCDCCDDTPGIHWVIVGGESGPCARPFDLAWARHIVEQCRNAGVACFVKQLGAEPQQDGASARRHGSLEAMRNRKGGDPAEWPADLRVREFPEARP